MKTSVLNKNERTKITGDDIIKIADRLNEEINVPFISEIAERKLLAQVIKEVDNFLYENLSPRIYNTIKNKDEGLDDKEAKRLNKSLARLAIKKIDIPVVPEPVEDLVIRFTIWHFVDAMRKGSDIEHALETKDG